MFFACTSFYRYFAPLNIKLYTLHIRCPLSVQRCTHCLGVGSGTVSRDAGEKPLQTLLSPLCPQVHSLSRGRMWDSEQSRCYGDAGVAGVAVSSKSWEEVAKAELLLLAESSARMPFGPFSPVRPFALHSPIFLKLPKLSPSRMGHYGQAQTPGQGQDSGEG